MKRAKRNPPDLILICLDGLIDDVVDTGQRIRRQAELSDDVAVPVFDAETTNESEKIVLINNV